MTILKQLISKSTLIALISLLFCVAIIITEISILSKNQTAYLESYGLEQEILVQETGKHISNLLTSKAGNDNIAIEELKNSLVTSGSRYWLLIKDDKILFIQNDNETSQLQIKNINNALQSYKMLGGHNIDEFIELINNKKNGSVMFSESNLKEDKLASVVFFQVNDAHYSIALCTTKNYILDSGNIYANNFSSIIAIVAFSLILFSIVIITLIIIDKRNKEIDGLNKLIQSKNQKIEQLTTPNSEIDSLYDKQNNIYNAKVFESLVKKINDPRLFPISKIAVDITISDEITYDAIVAELTPVLNKLMPQTGIVARTLEKQLTILLFKTDFNAANNLQTKLINSSMLILKKYKCTAKTNVILLNKQVLPSQSSDGSSGKSNKRKKRKN